MIARPALRPDGPWFRDAADRRLLLRGVNLGGSSKVPTLPDGRTHLPSDFSDHRTVSFVGRPFPPHEADEHFRRLRHWGFNCLRLLTTWEAIEHAGPGQYDEPYLDSFAEIARLAGEYGFFLFVDPHQDAWSRMSGGDGAPGWTLELAGFDIARLDASEAAVTQQRHEQALRGYPYAPMIWPNNWGRLASATMATLFFGGDRFAPSLRVGDESIQQFLQRHFIAAMQQVAERMAGMPHVLGYDSLNEPSRGFLGLPSLRAPFPVYGSAPRLTPFQSMIVGAGFPVTVPLIERDGLHSRVAKQITLNPQGHSAWRSPGQELWRREGVWEVDEQGKAQLLRDDYFADFHFFRDGVRPFARRYIAALRELHPGALLFVEGEPGDPESLVWPEAAQEGVVNASHWYDVLTLGNKHYNPAACLVWGREGETVTGVEAVEESFAEQLGAIVAASAENLGGVPTLIGEMGVPFDLDGGLSFESNDFSAQAVALDAYMDALDATLAHATLWNYTSDNANAHGDGWNGEDLSLFSRDQQWNPYDLDSGGRAIEGFVRPTVRAAAGRPLRQWFDRTTGDYELRLHSEPGNAPTLLYVPRLHYQAGYEATVSSGEVAHEPLRQELSWVGADAGEQWLRLRRM